jgi:hypothetical protein
MTTKNSVVDTIMIATATEIMADWNDTFASEAEVRAEAARIATMCGINVQFDQYGNPTFVK